VFFDQIGLFLEDTASYNQQHLNALFGKKVVEAQYLIFETPNSKVDV
jgi:hypothetical protein